MKKIFFSLAITMLLAFSLSAQNSLYIGPYSGSDNQGRIAATGTYAELSLSNRTVTSFVNNPTLGERWVIYNTGTSTNGSLRFWTGGDKVTFTKEGNVYIGSQIGTNSGNGRLSVSGNSAELSLSNRKVSTFVEDPTNGERWVIYNDGSTTDGKLRFWTDGDKVVFTKEGSVGIGTANPQSKLAVEGQIRATEVKVLADISVPDYVFEPDYELRTLKETKAYISENKHLPEIPSAAEIGENGIDLGDMNMRLLKKIEELTLYQIELLERLEQLEFKNAEIDELKKKIELLEKK